MEVLSGATGFNNLARISGNGANMWLEYLHKHGEWWPTLNEVKRPGLPWKAMEQGFKEFKNVSKLEYYTM